VSTAAALREARGFLFDIDGSLILSDVAVSEGATVLPGAPEVLARLRASGRRICLFTNGATRPPEEYVGVLRGLGLDVGEDEVLTPAVVGAKHVARTDPGAPVLVFGGAGAEEPLRRLGAEIVPIADAKRARFVFVGPDHEFNYTKLHAACEAIWAGAQVLFASNAPWFAVRSGRMIGVAGAITAGLVHVTGTKPLLVGKPSSLALEVATTLLGVTPEELVIVGDDPVQEVQMGREGGAFTVLVLTGITGDSDVDGENPLLRPHLVVPNVGHLLEYL